MGLHRVWEYWFRLVSIDAKYDADITLKGNKQQIAIEVKNRYNINSNTSYRIDDFKEFNLSYSKYKSLEAIACNRPCYLVVIYPTDRKALVWQITNETRNYPNVQVKVPRFTLTDEGEKICWQKTFPIKNARTIDIPEEAIEKMRCRITDLRKRMKNND